MGKRRFWYDAENPSAGGKADEIQDSGDDASAAQRDVCVDYEYCAADIDPEECTPAPDQLEAFCCAAAPTWETEFWYCEDDTLDCDLVDDGFGDCVVEFDPSGESCVSEDAITCCEDGGHTMCEYLPEEEEPQHGCDLVDDGFGDCVVEFDRTGESCINDAAVACCEDGGYTMCEYLE